MDLAKLMQEKARIESKIVRAKKAEKAAERKADSHRKIILGSVLIAAVRKGGISESSVHSLIDRHAADKDKAVFEGWTFKKPETVPTPAETTAVDSQNEVAGE